MNAKDTSLKALLDITAVTNNAVAKLNEKKKNRKPYTPYKPDYISTDGWKEGNNPWNTLSDYGGGSNSSDDDVSSDPFIVENEEYRDDGSGESQNYFDRHEGERDEWWDPNSEGNRRDDDSDITNSFFVRDIDIVTSAGINDKDGNEIENVISQNEITSQRDVTNSNDSKGTENTCTLDQDLQKYIEVKSGIPHYCEIIDALNSLYKNTACKSYFSRLFQQLEKNQNLPDHIKKISVDYKRELKDPNLKDSNYTVMAITSAIRNTDSIPINDRSIEFKKGYPYKCEFFVDNVVSSDALDKWENEMTQKSTAPYFGVFDDQSKADKKDEYLAKRKEKIAELEADRKSVPVEELNIYLKNITVTLSEKIWDEPKGSGLSSSSHGSGFDKENLIKLELMRDLMHEICGHGLANLEKPNETYMFRKLEDWMVLVETQRTLEKNGVSEYVKDKKELKNMQKLFYVWRTTESWMHSPNNFHKRVY